MRKFFGPALLIIIALLILFGGTIVGLYTDWLWFDDLGYGVVFSTSLVTRLGIGIVFGLVFFAIIYGNLWYARRIAPPPSPTGIEQQLLERLGALARRGIGLLIFAGSVVVAALVGLEATTHYNEWLLFSNASRFGVVDPVFGHDIGYYVFKLPFLSYLYYWLFFALIASTIASVALHYADEAIETFGNRLQFAPRVKAHLAVLVAAMFFLKAWGYRLSMFDLLTKSGKQFDGAGYSAVHANVPALWIMTVIAAICGIIVLAGIWRRGVGNAVAAVVILLGASLLVGSVYPGLVQQFEVGPNELAKETPFIERAIKATQDAYGLTEVAARPFEADTTLTPDQIASNIPTIENIRLWDKVHLLDAYSQIQTIQQYYQFADVDIDRYWLADKPGAEKRYRQVWLAARELEQSALPQQSQTWVNKHLQYTHGYGFCMSPVNEVTTEGLPEFFVYDIPPKTTVDIPIDRMGVYFGERTDAYAFVKTSAKEFAYPSGKTTVTTEYEADSGVGIGGFLRRALFALRFQDFNILLNDNIEPRSRILFGREIKERARKLLPFLQFDADPYLVTVDGNLYWMQDAYTLTNSYPYSAHTRRGIEFNYIRNSVKTVTDAYTGKVTAYVVQKPLRDPIIETYMRIFPGILKPVERMPAQLREHIRYAEDFFRIQADVYSRYHMTDPTMFYNNSDLWAIPNKAELTDTQAETAMDPYYVIMKLPNGKSEEFILMTPYVRAGKANMVSWMCAKCDESDYGRLVLYQFPKDKNVFGPQQIASRARQDATISQQMTLWSQAGSKVGSGNLLVIPIESSLLYVMPVYLVSTSTGIPELKRVIVALGDKVSMGTTMQEALSSVVGESVAAAPNVSRRGVGATGSGSVSVAGARLDAEATRLVNQAVSQYDKSQDALRRGDWAAYGEYVRALKATLNQLQQKAR